MSANIGAYPSLTWRSIWSARGLIEKGFGWHVGTGEQVNIWNDLQLPIPGIGRVSYKRIYIRWSTVDQLINSETNTWDENRVRLLLGLDQAE
ncbi:hypothetical protein J1N35_002088 [Gossypium stocksii]|uniref:Uncharacterized protein n=1 Tax=Gossypium stocksii TaxID=47602 RepID=A0A9D4AK85_9ROSI|nr:hypothetical protein J1N35_002088 [Gossypium stocksii]